MNDQCPTQQTTDENPEHVFLQANKRHFDHIACRYDQNINLLTLARKSARAILNAYPFKEDETSVMDYACGSASSNAGLISRELAPYAKTILGVDISQGMVDQYNLRVHNQGIPPEEMCAICTVLEGKAEELEGKRFDVVVCASAYHHIQSIEQVTEVLAYFLKPGGSLVVTDLEKTDVDVHQSDIHIVPHPGGISKADIQQAFQHAGLDSFTYEPAFNAKMKGSSVTLFIAQGVKPWC
ncbi:hypothetical protein APHAL10511_007123 [Amanita phalloides]|nr:hypothetical protein APHAL10511_007123 [Amanita phalloides]